ncbi:MAG: hypothetical protein CMB97_05105 [Flavobacteriaceae bacterium]|nr:hypothetical protein [Flavobacteriaceae bacterium]
MNLVFTHWSAKLRWKRIHKSQRTGAQVLKILKKKKCEEVEKIKNLRKVKIQNLSRKTYLSRTKPLGVGTLT